MVQSARVNWCRRTSASLSCRLQLEHTMWLGQHDCMGGCSRRRRDSRRMEGGPGWVRVCCIEGLWLFRWSKVLVSSSWAHWNRANSLCYCRPRIFSLRRNWPLSCLSALATQRSVVQRKIKIIMLIKVNWKNTDLIYCPVLEKRLNLKH